MHRTQKTLQPSCILNRWTTWLRHPTSNATSSQSTLHQTHHPIQSGNVLSKNKNFNIFSPMQYNTTQDKQRQNWKPIHISPHHPRWLFHQHIHHNQRTVWIIICWNLYSNVFPEIIIHLVWNCLKIITQFMIILFDLWKFLATENRIHNHNNIKQSN